MRLAAKFGGAGHHARLDTPRCVSRDSERGAGPGRSDRRSLMKWRRCDARYYRVPSAKAVRAVALAVGSRRRVLMLENSVYSVIFHPRVRGHPLEECEPAASARRGSSDQRPRTAEPGVIDESSPSRRAAPIPIPEAAAAALGDARSGISVSLRRLKDQTSSSTAREK